MIGFAVVLRLLETNEKDGAQPAHKEEEMKRILIVVTVAVVVSSPLAWGTGLICGGTTTMLSGTINQNVDVLNGATCIVTANTIINGSVQVGSPYRYDPQNPQGDGTKVGAAYLWVALGVVIKGNVRVGPGSGAIVVSSQISGNYTHVDAASVLAGTSVTGYGSFTGGSSAIFSTSIGKDVTCNGGGGGVITGGTTIGGSTSGCPTGTLNNLDFLQTAVDQGTGDGSGNPSGGEVKLTCDQAVGFVQTLVPLADLLSTQVDCIPCKSQSIYLSLTAENYLAVFCPQPSTTP
jgi:hypothetical protein